MQKILNLETAVRDGKVMQDFDSESFPTGGSHSQMVKGPPVGNDSGSKDCVNLPSPTAVSRLKEPSFFALFLLISFGSVSAVLFTPGLPEIAQHLSISKAKAQSAISIFLLGYTFSLLLYGPLSNRIGRKPAATVGISMAIIGCLVTLLVEKFHSFSLLIAGRLLMALGSSVGLKISFTLIADVYRDDKATKKIASLLPSFAIMPAIAVGIGGVLTHQFGWLSCFYFQTIYSIFLLFIVFSLPETCLYKDPDALQPKKMAAGYFTALKNRKLLLCAMLMGLGVSMIYLFATEAPFTAMNAIGLTPDVYGFLNFIPNVGLVLGSIIANFLAGKERNNRSSSGGSQ